MTRDELQAAARRYVQAGTRWRHKGRTETGLDCVGLLVVVGQQFGMTINDLADYSAFPNGTLEDHLKAHFDVVAPPYLPGQAVLLTDDHMPCHVGILGQQYGQLTLIHASISRRRVFEEPLTTQWRARMRCLLEFPGVTNG
jgi:hypothetical protein